MTEAGSSVGRDDEGLLIAAGDIARIAGVGRAAVSNWRRRFPDFPQPVAGTAASPLFALDTVQRWLTEHDKPARISDVDRLWPQIRAAADELRLAELVAVLGAFLVWRRRAPGAWERLRRSPEEEQAQTLSAEVAAGLPAGQALPMDGAWPDTWVGLLGPLSAAVGDDPATVFDELYRRLADSQVRRIPTTGAQLADVMIRIAGIDPATQQALDPACGTGSLLLAAQRAGARQVFGQDVNATAALIAADRLLLHGPLGPGEGPVQVRAGDSLRADLHRGLLADAVVCDPPVNARAWGYDELGNDPRWEYGLPPSGEGELAWLQHCLSHAEPGAPVVVVMPAAAAARRAGRRIRANLLRAGALRAVIALPAELQPAGLGPHLWVLRRPPLGPASSDATPDTVLMADARADLELAATAWQAFRDDRAEQLPTGATAVPVTDLLAGDVDLTPGVGNSHAVVVRHKAGAGGAVETSTGYPNWRDRVQSWATALPALVPAQAAGPEEAASEAGQAFTTLGDLISAGAVTVHRTEREPERDSGTQSCAGSGQVEVLTVADVRSRGPASAVAPSDPDLVAVQAGDVVVPTHGRDPVVRLIDAPGPVLGDRLTLFRPDPVRLDPRFLAGCLRLAARASRPGSGSSFGRLDARRAKVPVLPLEQQRRVGAALHRLEEADEHLRWSAEHAAQALVTASTGLLEGTMMIVDEEPASPWSRQG